MVFYRQKLNKMLLKEFLRFINLEGILLEEGIKQARKLYQKKFNTPLPKFLENQIINIDPSQNKKYAEWIIRVSPDFSDSTLNKIKRLLSIFYNLVSKNIIIKDKSDINRYKSIEELENILKQYENIKTKTEIEKETKSKGAKKVFENDKVIIYQILSFEASCLYGHDTKWCISAKDYDSSSFWEGYYRHYNIYFIISKNPVQSSRLNKIAVLENKETFLIEKGQIFDQEDNLINPEDFIQIIKQNNLPIKHLNLRLSETKEIENFFLEITKDIVPSQFKRVFEFLFFADLYRFLKIAFDDIIEELKTKRDFFVFNFSYQAFKEVIINKKIDNGETIKNVVNNYLKNIELDNNNNFKIKAKNIYIPFSKSSEKDVPYLKEYFNDFKSIDNLKFKFEYIEQLVVSLLSVPNEKQEIIKYFITKTMKDATIPYIHYIGLKAENLINLIPSKNQSMAFLRLQSCQLNSLEGCPSKIYSFQLIDIEGLKNLIGAPKDVNSLFFINFDDDISLEGFPQKVISIELKLSYINYKILFRDIKYLPSSVYEFNIEIYDVPSTEKIDKIEKEVENLIKQNCKTNNLYVSAYYK